MIVTDVAVVTFLWATVKVIVVFPEATFTLEGTVAAAVFELLRVTVAPVLGAIPESVMVPVTPFVELP